MKSSSKRQKRDSSPTRRKSRPLSSQTNMSLFQKGGSEEKKWVDIAQNAAFPSGSTVGVLTLLNGLQVGGGANQRIGTRIDMKSIAVRGLYQSGTGAGDTLGPVRIKIVYDKEARGAAPVATDILTNDFIYSHNNLDNGGRFITVLDKTYYPALPGQSGALGRGGYLAINEYVKLNLPVKYNTSTAGTVGDIVSGSLYMLTYSSGMTTSTAGGNDEIITRVRYTDV